MNRSDISWRLLIAALLIAVALSIADLLIPALRVVFLTFAGLLFGIFLHGLSRWTTRHTPLSYSWSFTIVVVLLLSLLGGGVWYLGSQIASRASVFARELQSAAQDATKQLEQSQWAQEIAPNLNQAQQQMMGSEFLAKKAMNWLGWLAWGVTGCLVIFFVGLYSAFDPHLYRSGLMKLAPPDRRQRASEVLSTLQSALESWIVGRFISMAIIGIFTAIGLWWLNVPMPFTLGVVAALLTFIPNIGPVLAAVPQALLALQVGTNTVVYVIIFNIALQTVESYLITPIVQRHEVSLPPALTIFVQLLLSVVAGIVGLFMAAPLTVAAMVLVQALYIQDRLGDPHSGRLTDG